MLPLTKKIKNFVRYTKKKRDNDCKVQDHCHYICKYKGAPYSICILRYIILLSYY